MADMLDLEAERGTGALVLIGGTTASGKSALALEIARRCGGVVVNADSQQLFRDLPILTARPSAADEAAAEHRLYGVMESSEQPSVGRWHDLVLPVLRGLLGERRAVLVVGGTGLYLHALLHGLSPIPEVAAEIRPRLEAEASGVPSAALHRRLGLVDPATAAKLRPSDRQRILRALEVLEGTGTPLAVWQALPRRRPDLPRPVAALALVPAAEIVARRSAQRLDAMLGRGALDELDGLRAAHPDLGRLPIAKVHGVRELLAVLEGGLPLEEAKERIAAQVRQYAKRQRTFLRHQLPELGAMPQLGDAPPGGGLVESVMRRIEARSAAPSC
jgi:tRNA dimethylallyltransferase